MQILRRTSRAAVVFATIGLFSFGCGDETPSQASVQSLRAGFGSDGHVYLGVDVLVTDASGAAIPCGEGKLDLTVSVKRDDETRFRRLSSSAVNVTCSDRSPGDFALVVDNSGSAEGYLPQLQDAAKRFIDTVVPAGGRASVVRVSTNATVQRDVTSSTEDLHRAIDEMFVTNGWTSLYDGIRIGNETLGQATKIGEQNVALSHLNSFCTSTRKSGIVVFTDGRENNSSGERFWSTEYPGDGVNTSLDDLFTLELEGTTTPVYTVGLGNDVDHELLQRLAEHTGGRHLAINSPDEIPLVYGLIGEYNPSSHDVCVEVPEAECGWMTVKIEHKWQKGRNKIEGSREERIHIDCPEEENGRTATVLLTMSNPGISMSLAKTLASQTVAWVSPVARPKVLVVRDDNHHNEFEGDARYVKDLLRAAGYDVQLIEEPSDGITTAQLSAYDVVWFSNPGYPLDSEASRDALLRFSAQGGGVVLQGDDMGYSWGNNFSMAPLSHLEYIDNGVSYCGVSIDNNQGGRYQVRFDGGDHPIVDGINQTTFFYGDDIDTTNVLGDGEQVLAWATAAGANNCALKPVIVVKEP